MKNVRLLAFVVMSALVATTCTGGGEPTTRTTRTSLRPSNVPPAKTTAVSPPPCDRPKPSHGKPAKGATLPPALARVAHQVERVRGLKFRHRIGARPVSREEMNRLLAQGLDDELPASFAAKEQRAWITIGALPEGTNLRKALAQFGQSAIVGFYDTESRRLVFLGTQSPSAFGRFVLSHELTHALDDQYFDLSRLDQFNSNCEDERAEAFLSLAEGDAQVTSFRWARENLAAGDVQELLGAFSGSSPTFTSVPKFVVDMLNFPYGNGQAFVEQLLEDGGDEAINEAFRNPPVSTEQILHPDKYPRDVPQDVNVPNFGPSLGHGWKDLEFEEVGEGFLSILLGLRLADDDAAFAAKGWDGGQYRAWALGKKKTAVVLDTAWDDPEEAKQFAEAMKDWIGERNAEVISEAARVRVLFGSDRRTLSLLESVAGTSASSTPSATPSPAR